MPRHRPAKSTRRRAQIVQSLGTRGADREELRRLIEELPDEQVPAVLAEARRQLAPRTALAWPPPSFGAIEADRADIA